MESPLLRIKYQKYKLRIKLWESAFMKKYGRKPSKIDIKAADKTIREAYKIYWKLKTRALYVTSIQENSRRDNENTFHSDDIVESVNEEGSNERTAIKSDQIDSGIITPDEELTNVLKINNVEVWSQHLKNSNDFSQVGGSSTDKNRSDYIDNSPFQLSQEKFQSLNFLKRNPRRSISQKIESNSGKEIKIPHNPIGTNKLEKVSLNYDDTSICLLENINLLFAERKFCTHPVNTYHQILNQSPFHKRQLNQGWLNRCDVNNSLENDIHDCKQLLESEFQEESSSMEFPLHEDFPSDDDYIYKSDCEGQRMDKRIRNHNNVISAEDLHKNKKPCMGKKLSGLNDEKIDDLIQDNLSIDDINSNISSDMKDSPSLSNASHDKFKEFDPWKIKCLKDPVVEVCESKDNRKEFKHQASLKEIEKYVVENSDEKQSPNVRLFNEKENSDEYGFSYKISTQHDPSPYSSLNVNDPVLSKEIVKTNKIVENLNTNFVRINLKKKVFVRGRNASKYSKYRKNQWERKKKRLNDPINKRDKYSCFKCGQIGHFCKDCNNSEKCKSSISNTNVHIESGPTLEEAENEARSNVMAVVQSFPNKSILFPSYANNQIKVEHPNIMPPSTCEEKGESIQKISHRREINSIYQLNADGSIKDTPLEVFVTLEKFGHSHFREGQEIAIMRILSGLSTLVSIATGFGKSLCYQLPAYIYAKRSKCITIVVTPLVSLMEDQICNMPHFLSAACLHSNQTPTFQSKIFDNLEKKKVDILLISPETLVLGDKSNSFRNLFSKLPPIAFACIDEAHCISQWSHNFRPSYMMVCKSLNENLGIKRILALTATASKSTTLSIVNLLNIQDKMTGVISGRPVPFNLYLSVSQDDRKDEALITLLRSERFVECDSIIIYCTRREECVRIAKLLRISFQDYGSKRKVMVCNKTEVSIVAEAYHAGLSSQQRKVVQTAFMESKTKIVVATIAFGMGINKSNIRSVIHYNMPANIESYVQEIGRAGRDGLPAFCHLFLSHEKNADECELRRHIHAHGIDRHTIRRLLQKIFVPCDCIKQEQTSRCPGHGVAFSIDETVKSLDISEEIISTLLCYIELHERNFLRVLPPIYVNASVHSKNGTDVLEIVAKSAPHLAAAFALLLENGMFSDHSSIKVSVIDIAAVMGLDSDYVKNELKNLEWEIVNGMSIRSSVTVVFDTLSFHVTASGDLTSEELNGLLDLLDQRTQSQTLLQLQQLEYISTNLRKSSFASVGKCFESTQLSYSKSEEIKRMIRIYFEEDRPLCGIHTSTSQHRLENETQIIKDIGNLILSYPDVNFTGRIVARIFHGIQSPNFPAFVWAKCRFWRSHLAEDFHMINQIATTEILKLKES